MAIITLFFFALFYISVTGTGLLLVRRLSIETTTAEKLLFGFGIGLGITGYVVFVLAALQLLYSFVLYVVLILLLLAGIFGWYKAEMHSFKDILALPSRFVEKIALGGLLILIITAFLLTFTPEIGRDALSYHLAVPKKYLVNHGIFFIPGNIYANFPLHTELIFLVGLFLQGDILAKTINFAVFIHILFGMWVHAQARSRVNEFPFLSLLIFSMIPSVFVASQMAYIDLFVVLYIYCAMILYLRWLDNEKKSEWLLLIAVFTGLAMASKYTALIIPVIGSFGLLWAYRTHKYAYPAFRTLFTYLTISFLVASPYYIKNWYLTGNPLYPFFYGVFGGRGWDAEQARLFDSLLIEYMGMGRRLVDYFLLPWNVSMHAQFDSIRFDGIIGPLFLLMLPFLFWKGSLDRTGKIFAFFCLTLFLFWSFSSQQIRYLFPVFPLLALIIGQLATYYQNIKIVSFIILVLISGALILNGYHIVKHLVKIQPHKYLFGLEKRKEFLNRSLSSYSMYDYINTNLPSYSKIMLVYMRNYTYFCERDCYSDSVFESYTLQKMLSQASSPETFHAALKEQGFSHILINDEYVTGKKTSLTLDQVSLFSAARNKYLNLLKSDRDYYLYSM